MSCLMESLQDKRVRLQPECKNRLQDRMDMWSYAAKVRTHTHTEREHGWQERRKQKYKGFFLRYHPVSRVLTPCRPHSPSLLPPCPQVAPAEGLSDLAMQVMTSPSKNYILAMIGLGVSVLFLLGLLCGRITKRVTQELKDR